ncbi:MAG TPA: YicC/YloC family endoribonuclease [Bryobacteraceae bacterium]|nr:YicC/YloC family endoribonuclease [Bryobacteraceae bacterium]
MSARSMTGFARVRKTAADGEIAVGIKSVNHRGLDMHFHMAPELDPFEGAIRNAVKAKVARGHVQIHVAFSRAAPADASSLNRPLLQAYLQAFREAAGEFGTDSKPDLNAALRVPGMLQAGASAEPDAGLEQALLEATEEALGVLNRFREREGAAMAAEMRERCASVCELVAQMEKIRSRATAAFQKRLNERLRELLRGAGIEPQRLAQEAAMLAERSDISEELIRLKTHAAQLEKLLDASGEVGKRLDFLLQEMNREANTILSKTGGLGDLGLTITDLALAAKAEIDKLREQSLNLE